jgi:hypothetical protein
VYELTAASWSYNSLYVFTGGTDGLYVFSNLVLVKGKLYGTTNQGGANGFGVCLPGHALTSDKRIVGRLGH